MPADDLVGAVPLDVLGAGVPADDAARRVEHVDGVVLDAFDHQAEALLALAQGVAGALALDEVRRLPRVEVGQAQFLFRRTMRQAEMRRDHAEGFAAAAQKGRRLHGPEAGCRGLLAVREPGTGLHVLDDHALAPRQRRGTRAARAQAPEMIEKVLPEAALDHDLERLILRTVEVDAAEVRLVQLHGRIEHDLQRPVEIGRGTKLERRHEGGHRHRVSNKGTRPRYSPGRACRPCARAPPAMARSSSA